MLFGVFFGSFIFFLCSLGGDKTLLYQIVCSTLCGFEGYFMLREFFGALGAFLDIVDEEEAEDDEE